jgi:hypothetical protein
MRKERRKEGDKNKREGEGRVSKSGRREGDGKEGKGKEGRKDI